MAYNILVQGFYPLKIKITQIRNALRLKTFIIFKSGPPLSGSG